MRFQLATALIALLPITLASSIVDDKLDARAVAAAGAFTFGEDFDAPLNSLFGALEGIPDEVLGEGDEATDKWLVDHGLREPGAKLKRDETFSALEADILARDAEPEDLVARASIWKIAKCVAAIVQLLATTAVPAAKLLKIKGYIKALGGAKQAVKLMLGATTKAEKLKAGGEILVNLSAELLGINSVKSNCF